MAGSSLGCQPGRVQANTASLGRTSGTRGAPARALTGPLGADGLPDEQGHGVAQVVAGLGEAPPVPLRAGLLGPVVAVDDPLQPGDGHLVPGLPGGGRPGRWGPSPCTPHPALHPQHGAHPPRSPGEPRFHQTELCWHGPRHGQGRGFWDSGRCRGGGALCCDPHMGNAGGATTPQQTALRPAQHGTGDPHSRCSEGQPLPRACEPRPRGPSPGCA